MQTERVQITWQNTLVSENTFKQVELFCIMIKTGKCSWEIRINLWMATGTVGLFNFVWKGKPVYRESLPTWHRPLIISILSDTETGDTKRFYDDSLQS